MMASRAMGVAVEEVEFFYADDDLVLDDTGHATIRQRKDAFYVLEDGTWDRARFMSCMSAMHWATIDYLPVVELFKSLLPGTGSAAFELIRGLYDDQNPQNPRPLQYRGIPTYPSAAAFGLFSNFFTATHRGGENPFTVFMDPPRSQEVDWVPNSHPPVRERGPASSDLPDNQARKRAQGDENGRRQRSSVRATESTGIRSLWETGCRTLKSPVFVRPQDLTRDCLTARLGHHAPLGTSGRRSGCCKQGTFMGRVFP